MKRILKILICTLLLFNMFGCSSDSEKTTAGINDGEYVTTAEGRNGEITVTTKFENQKIVSVTVDEHQETEGISDSAIENIPQRIVENQSTAVDVVSGATITSEAIISAVEQAITDAGGQVDDWRKEVNEEIAVENEECDVLVIGGGGAGMMAAISAAQNGASVILVEKQGTLGGNTALARGVFGCSNSSYQIENGINVSTQDHIDYYMSSYPDADIDMITILAENGGKAADWLQENGMVFEGTQGDFTLVPENHRLGSSVLEICTNLMDNYNVDVRTDTKATSLMTNTDGDVIGAKVQIKNNTYEIKAKSVVMASGGFAANNEMVTEYNEIYEGLGYICTPGDTGDGHVMAAEVGAELAYMDVMKANPFLYYDEDSGNYTMIGTYVNPGIVVDSDGNRLGNEHLNYYFSPYIVDKKVYLIYNEKVKSSLEAPDVSTVSYDSIEDLASAANIDVDGLKNTLEKFKVSAENGEDEFGRTVFVDDLSAGPYYVVELTPAMQGTFGGILINENAEALKEDGTVLNGLYAAGECAGDGLYGANPVPTDFVFGKIAGENAAKYAAK